MVLGSESPLSVSQHCQYRAQREQKALMEWFWNGWGPKSTSSLGASEAVPTRPRQDEAVKLGVSGGSGEAFSEHLSVRLL